MTHRPHGPALLCIPLFGLLAACAPVRYQVPVPADHPREEQLHLQAARHWDRMAGYIADELLRELKAGGLEGSPISLRRPDPQTASAFDRALHDLLVTRLTRAGALLWVTRDAANVLDIETQMVEFDDGRRNGFESWLPHGTYTILAAGLIAMNPHRSWSDTKTTVIATAAAAGVDLGLAELQRQHPQLGRDIPDVELLVHASLRQGNRLLARRSDIFYVSTGDANLYRAKPEQKRSDRTLFQTIKDYDATRAPLR